MSQPTRRPPVAFRWWQSHAYLLLTLITITSFAASGLASPLFAIRAQDLGAAFWEIGLIGMVGQIAGTAVQYLWGRQSDRVMRRVPLVWLGMGGWGLSLLLVGLVGSHLPLYPIQALAGLANAAKGVGTLALIGDILEGAPNRGRLMGLHRGLGSFAFGLAALFGGSLADAHSTALPFLISAGLVALGTLLALWLREAAPHMAAHPALDVAEGVEPIPWRQVWRVSPFLIVVFIWMLANNSAFTFWPVFMRDQGLTQTAITRLWGLAALGETVAMVAGIPPNRQASTNLLKLHVVAGDPGAPSHRPE